MLTKEKAIRVTEPIEQVYASVTSQLLINLASHLKGGDITDPARWEMQKLAELGALTKESTEIIQAATNNSDKLLQDALQSAVSAALADTELRLSSAAAKGLIQAPSGAIKTSRNIAAVVDAYLTQAVQDTNLVNTVMLESTLNQYRQAISIAANTARAQQIERLLSASGTEIVAQLDRTQKALNTAAASVSLAGSSQQKAVRAAIKHLASRGITGFVDKAGRQWSPEAYVTMDVRTTVHNAAIQAQKTRSAEYGVTTFQISSHPGARPLCAPYQGWVCSWDNTPGVIQDLNGNPVQVHALSETSYGEPAGIFGINCGHFPSTFVPGYSLLRYSELSSAEAQRNDERYQEFQTQRSIERAIRKAKTDALVYDAAGDTEGFEKASLLVHDRTAKYKSYCAQHNLTTRIYRTQVVAYNKSISAKAAHAAATARLRIQLRAAGVLPSGSVIHLNPLRISQAELSFDAEHINTRQHHVTEAQARDWIERALFSVTVWRGEFERFYSELGAVYVNLRTNTIRTAYTADEYDERTKKLIEVYQDAKARKR